MASLPPFVRVRPDGVELLVRLTPRSSRTAIEGTRTAADGSVRLAVRVTAVPEKGKANAALEKVLAESLATPTSSVSVIAGETHREKTVFVRGDPGAIAEAVALLAGA